MRFTSAIATLFVATASSVYAIPTKLGSTDREASLLLSKRSVPDFTATGGNCGAFATAVESNTDDNSGLLKGKGSDSCKATKGTCSRLACKNTSAVYLCAAEDQDAEFTCSSIGDLSERTGECLNLSLTSLFGTADPLSSQFFDSDGHNVVVAFGDCSDSTDTKPSSYATPGPNGDPQVTCDLDPSTNLQCTGGQPGETGAAGPFGS